MIDSQSLLIRTERERLGVDGLERRAVATVLRTEQSAADRFLVGHASVFGVRTTIGNSFHEIVDPHAFDQTLADRDDVRALFNHDPSWILARTKSGTLSLSTDTIGLLYKAKMNLRSPQHVTVMEALDRGDVDQSSFGFQVREDRWEDNGGDLPTRTILNAKLWDVSPVTYAAYPSADSGLRDQRNLWLELNDYENSRIQKELLNGTFT
jgi:HK97 family phage prohead protease